MRKLLIPLFILCWFGVKAQNPVVVTQPYIFNKFVHVKGSLFSDSTLLNTDSTNRVPTTAWVKRNFGSGGGSTTTIYTKDSTLNGNRYVHSGGYWLKFDSLRSIYVPPVSDSSINVPNTEWVKQVLAASTVYLDPNYFGGTGSFDTPWKWASTVSLENDQNITGNGHALNISTQSLSTPASSGLYMSASGAAFFDLDAFGYNDGFQIVGDSTRLQIAYQTPTNEADINFGAYDSKGSGIEFNLQSSGDVVRYADNGSNAAIRADSLAIPTMNILTDAVNSGNSGILTGLGTTVVTTTATTVAGTWEINGIDYAKGTSTNTTIPAQDATLSRFTDIYATTSSTILGINGTLSTDPIEPTLPANTVLVASILITPTSITVNPGPGRGRGTVTNVTGSNSNGFAWTITTPTTTPNLKLRLATILPATVAQTPAGTAGTDSVMVKHSGGVMRAISPTYFAPSSTAVTAVSVASANGFTGSSSGGTTPALTLTLNTIKPNVVAQTPSGTAGTDSVMVKHSDGTIKAISPSYYSTGGGSGTNYKGYGASSGTNTYTATIGSAVAYTTGDIYTVLFGNANTTANPTININSIGAVYLQRNFVTGTGDFVAGDIAVNQVIDIMYNGTNFQQVQPSGFIYNQLLAAQPAQFWLNKPSEIDGTLTLKPGNNLLALELVNESYLQFDGGSTGYIQVYPVNSNTGLYLQYGNTILQVLNDVTQSWTRVTGTNLTWHAPWEVTGNVTAQTSSQTVKSVTTVATAMHTVQLSADVTAGTGTVVFTATYTDENSNSQTVTFGTLASGVTAYSPVSIWAKTGTSITITATVTGTITYDAVGVIQQQ